jgi:translation initiation factor IF-2
VCGIRNQPIRNVEKRSSEQFELQELRKRVRQLEADRQRSIEMVEQSVRDLEEARRCCSEQLISVQEKVDR